MSACRWSGKHDPEPTCTVRYEPRGMTFSALDSAITGPLFATAEMRSVFSDRSRLEAMLKMEAALARVQARVGLVPAGARRCARRALAGPVRLRRPGPRHGAGRRAGDSLRQGRAGAATEEPGARLPQGRDHAGYRRHGARPADARRLRTDQGRPRRHSRRTCAIGRPHRATPCVGRTYGQQAAPVTFGYKAAVWLTGIADVASQLPWLEAQALAVSYGGPVGTLASLREKGPELLEALAAELGLSSTPITWHALRGRIVATGPGLRP